MNFLLQALPVVLLACGLLAYRFFRRRSPAKLCSDRRELRRARYVIQELQTISRQVQTHLAQHGRSLEQFGQRLYGIEGDEDVDISRDLADEAEKILRPTLQLSSHIARAYEDLRQQTTLLLSFTEVRTDPLTGVGNRRALVDVLSKLLALLSRYGSKFSIAIVDIDHFKQVNDTHGHLHGDGVLRDVADLLGHCARETDMVTRYGGEEFVVVMPETDLVGACIFAERVRKMIKERLHISISGGVAEALPGESTDDLMGRADGALYEAKFAGRDCVFRHEKGDRAGEGERAPAGEPMTLEGEKQFSEATAP